MKTTWLLVLCLGAGLLTLTARAAHAAPLDDATADALFERGNQAYLHGDYKAAVDDYEQLLAVGAASPDLHYNLANAYAKSDRLGPAIYHYELALSLDPSQDDARANLDLMRQAASGRWQDKLQGAEKDPLWMRALQGYTTGGLTLLFLAAYVVMFGLALAVYLLPNGFARVALASLLAFSTLGAAGTGGLLFGRWYLTHKVEQAVVLPDELPVKEGPDPSTQTSFSVHAGLRLRLVEHEQDWVRVRLSNGLEGWVRDRDLGRL